jgi:hypothetical protein
MAVFQRVVVSLGVKGMAERFISVHLGTYMTLCDVVETKLVVDFCCKCFHEVERRCPPLSMIRVR